MSLKLLQLFYCYGVYVLQTFNGFNVCLRACVRVRVYLSHKTTEPWKVTLGANIPINNLFTNVCTATDPLHVGRTSCQTTVTSLGKVVCPNPLTRPRHVWLQVRWNDYKSIVNYDIRFSSSRKWNAIYFFRHSWLHFRLYAHSCSLANLSHAPVIL